MSAPPTNETLNLVETIHHVAREAPELDTAGIMQQLKSDYGIEVKGAFVATILIRMQERAGVTETKKWEVTPPAELWEFVRTNANAWDYNIGRAEQRIAVHNNTVLPVRVRAFDDATGELGDPLAAVGRDITSLGIGLATTEPVHHPLVQLEFEFAAENIAVITRILWSRAYGEYYYSGGRFIRLQEQPSPPQ